MRKAIIETIELLVICLIITLFWRFLEILMLGYINPSNVDMVIALILTFSLHSNYKTYKSRKKVKM